MRLVFGGDPQRACALSGWLKPVHAALTHGILVLPLLAWAGFADGLAVFGWLARDGSKSAHAREVTLADGKKLFYGPPAGTGDGGSAPAVRVR
jgi:hypothetical protein